MYVKLVELHKYCLLIQVHPKIVPFKEYSGVQCPSVDMQRNREAIGTSQRQSIGLMNITTKVERRFLADEEEDLVFGHYREIASTSLN
jgi:hypothetical protein